MAPSSRGSFSALPLELVFLIKEKIPHSDLRTHVCFFKTSSCIGQVYGDDTSQAGFWETACLLAGLGCLPGEHPDTVSWKQIALQCIQKDGFCSHPECGGERLEKNAESMKGCVHGARSYSDFHVLTHEGSPNTPDITTNSLVRHIEFSKGCSSYWEDMSPEHDAKLVLPYARSEKRKWSTLALHPVACRSFASFPPVVSMNIIIPTEIPKAINDYGVTIWDVQAALYSALDFRFTVEEIRDMLISMNISYLDVSPDHGCNVLKVFSTLRNFRSLLNYFAIDDIKLLEWIADDDFSAFKMDFRALNTMQPPRKLE